MYCNTVINFYLNQKEGNSTNYSVTYTFKFISLKKHFYFILHVEINSMYVFILLSNKHFLKHIHICTKVLYN